MRATMRNVGKAEFMALFHQYQSETLCAKSCRVMPARSGIPG